MADSIVEFYSDSWIVDVLLKVQLSDHVQSTKSPLRNSKKPGNPNGEDTAPTTGSSDDHDCHCSSDTNNCPAGSSESWMELSIAGDKPAPRFNHAAAVIGSKMVVVGGESGNGTLDDVQVSWGKKALLVGGKTDPSSEKVSGLRFEVSIHHQELAPAVSYVEPSGILLGVEAGKNGFSLVLVQLKEKDYLVAFGGSKKEPSNQVKVVVLEKNEHLPGSRVPTNKVPGKTLCQNRTSCTNLASQLNVVPPCPGDSVGQQNLASIIINEHGSSRRSMSETVIRNLNPGPGNISLRKQLNEEELVHSLAKNSLNDSYFIQGKTHDMRSLSNISGKVITEVIPSSSELDYTDSHFSDNDKLSLDEERVFLEMDDKSAIPSAPSTIPLAYETKMAPLIRKNGILEGQLAAAMAGLEAAEKNLSSALISKQEVEKKLCDTMKETELFKERLAGLELAHEEANSVSNLVHSDNVRLEHDVAFVRAVLDDTQKVEVNHLKQRLQSLENRAPTPRKPFQQSIKCVKD
ncbi:hypothetical protein V2J09_008697 [Rumex salicifolius]